MPPTPEEQARINAYWQGAPGQTMSAPDPAAYYGPPAPPQPALVNAAAALQSAASPPALMPVAPPPLAPGDKGSLAYRNAHPDPAAPPVTGAVNGAPVNPSVKTLAGPPPKPAPPPAPVPTGPTPEDDAALARFVASQAKKPVAVGGAGGGGSGNKDPYGVKAAQAGYLGTYDQERRAVEAHGVAKADQADSIARGRAELARRQEEDAAIFSQESEQAQREYDSRIASQQEQLEAVRSKKVDPLRATSDNGMKFLAVIGGLLGGIYQGANRLAENPFTKSLDKLIDRDIAAQEKDIETEKFAAGQRLNLLQQQRAIFKDTTLAKLQSRNMMYEAAKEQIAAEAARYDAPQIKALADQGIAGIDREQKRIQLELAKATQASAMAAAAAGLAQIKEVRAAYRDMYDKALAAGLTPEQAEAESARQVQNLYGGGAAPRAATATADPVANVPKEQRSEALKEQNERAKADAGARRIEKLFKQYDDTSIISPEQLAATKSSLALISKAHGGPGLSSDADLDNFITPNLPKVTDSAATLALKRNNLTEGIRASVPTPILDRYNPGWNNANNPVKREKP